MVLEVPSPYPSQTEPRLTWMGLDGNDITLIVLVDRELEECIDPPPCVFTSSS